MDVQPMSWFLLCVGVALSWFLVLPRKYRFVERFEWCVRLTEAMQAAFMSLGSAWWLLQRGPLSVYALKHVDNLGSIITFRDCPQPVPKIKIATFVVVIVSSCKSCDQSCLREPFGTGMYGYLYFDTLYELVLPMVKPNSFNVSFLVHHGAGILTHAVARRHVAMNYFAAFVYLAETSTVCLHVSWICNLTRRTDSLLFLINGGFGALCYLIFRVILPPITLFHIFQQRTALSSPSPVDDQEAPEWIFWFLVASHLSFFLINLCWLPDLIFMLRKKLFGPPSSSPKKKAS